MKKLALVLALTLAAFAGSAHASDWFANNVGIYTDLEATQNCVTMAPFTATPAYLIFTQMTKADINAWEIQLSYSNCTLLSFTVRHENVDVQPRPGEHMVGLAAPQPVVGGMFVAADLQLLVMNTNPGGISADGVFFHLMANRVPAYTNAQDVAEELHPVTQDGSPIMIINNGCVVEAETTSFGEVKSLFR